MESQLDSSAHTTSLAFQFKHAPPIYTNFTGSVHDVVYDGTLVMSGSQAPYRFTKVRSLYPYEQP